MGEEAEWMGLERDLAEPLETIDDDAPQADSPDATATATVPCVAVTNSPVWLLPFTVFFRSRLNPSVRICVGGNQETTTIRSSGPVAWVGGEVGIPPTKTLINRLVIMEILTLRNFDT